MSLAYRTTSDLTRALAACEVTSVELLDLLLERVERLNPPINAVVATAPEAGAAESERAPERRSRDRLASPSTGGLPWPWPIERLPT